VCPVEAVVVNVAVNGYGWMYPDCVRSHHRYAREHGYAVLRLTSAEVRVDRPDAAWVKLDLLLAALEDGAPWALLVDADADVTPATPRLESVAVEGRDVYAARGRSGRWNSGVLIVRNTASARALLRGIRDSWDTPVPEDQWGTWTDWGENGHVIHALDRYDGVHELPVEWNNSVDPDRPSFIRHRTGNLSQSGRLVHEVRRQAVKAWYRRRPSLTTRIADRSERLAWLVGQAERRVA